MLLYSLMPPMSMVCHVEHFQTKEKYNVLLVERLLRIIENACQSGMDFLSPIFY